MKTCQKCKQILDISEFYNNKRCAGKKDTTCKPCMKANARQYYAENREVVLARINNDWLKQKDSTLREKYGITLDDYKILWENQQGKCKICDDFRGLFEEPKRQLVVDHCHKNGQIRGLLCMACNTGLGQFKDRVELLNQAIKYLEVWA